LVIINSTSSTQSFLVPGVPQGLVPRFSCVYSLYYILVVLLCLFSILYPRSSLFHSDSSVGPHTYADDNQLLISFVTSEFSTNISHLQATVDLVSQWMSSNLFSLNSPKRNFSSWVFLLNFPKSPTSVFSRHLTPSLRQLPQLAILVSSLILHSLCPITLPQFLNLVSYPSVTSAE